MEPSKPAVAGTGHQKRDAPPLSPSDSDLLAPDVQPPQSPAIRPSTCLADADLFSPDVLPHQSLAAEGAPHTPTEVSVESDPPAMAGHQEAQAMDAPEEEVSPRLQSMGKELALIDKLLGGDHHPGMTLEHLVTQATRYTHKQILSGRRILPTFKIPLKSRESYISRMMEYTKLPMHICASYMVDTQHLHGICPYCMSKRHPIQVCPLWNALSKRKSAQPSLCGYPLGPGGITHSITHCPVLNGRSQSCFYRGHTANQGHCGKIEANRALFWSWASDGWLTQHHLDPRSSCGYYKVLTITTARMLEGVGGNEGLASLEVDRAIRMVDNYTSAESEMLGVEPCFTELVVRNLLQFFSSRPGRSGSANNSGPNTEGNSSRSRNRRRRNLDPYQRPRQ